jgi:hypothetical protein
LVLAVRHTPVFKVLMAVIRYFHLLHLLAAVAAVAAAHLEMEERAVLVVGLVQI